ncbi:unnamed protein product [Paramecium primaurelia]|uniref:Insulin-like growth factor binding protein, N-terminal n=1 Tax=Paramecium primaurelia TaxID=5886 RepID=A0A8S1PJY9_PARPR|nr:unnamed protein product [Paramecium primaurelia]
MQIFVFIILLQISASQWLPGDSQLITNQIYQEATNDQAYLYTENFIKSGTQYTTANFINCQSPLTSYITLDQHTTKVENIIWLNYQKGQVLSFDLYFHGTWNNQPVTMKIGSFSETIIYTSPTIYQTSGFCDNTPYEVKTFNYQFMNSYSGKMSFESSNINGMVSIRNIFTTQIKCYPSCMTCNGPEHNQCQSCFYDTISNNVCPPCPINQYYVKYLGCRNLCDFDSKLFKNGFCQEYPGNIQYYQVNYFQSTQFQNNQFYFENLKWSIKYDKNHFDTTVCLQFNVGMLFYGIFKYNSGIQRFVNEINQADGSKSIGLKIMILIFGDIPLEGGISIKLNNTYYGSIFRSSSGIQTHNVQIFDVISLEPCLTYSNCYKYELHMFVDIPQYPFLFSSQSNFTDNSAGWGLISISVTAGYCPIFCKKCVVSFECEICDQQFLKYRDGRCIYIHSCVQPYQKKNETHCIDFDDETPYSIFLVKEYIDYANDPTQISKYSILTQSSSPNVNFLKGTSIFYSYWKSYRVFGGPYVWAQAKFQRVHQIENPHHGITIGFYILFGPNFPSSGSFVYTIDFNPSVRITISDVPNPNDDGTKTYKVYQKINHVAGSLKMIWDCQGVNNEPITSYCAVYNYYIAVHQCQPFCLQCINEFSCTIFDDVVEDPNLLKFSQSECQSNQYYNRNEVKCLNCPSSCISCTSPIDCQDCQTSYTLTKLGCVCKQNQYEDSNQCKDCPTLCAQCLSDSYCIECFLTDFREPKNGQCVCMPEYYSVASSSICLQCHVLCKVCNGPSFHDCQICKDIIGIEQVGTTCQCPNQQLYNQLSNSCTDVQLPFSDVCGDGFVTDQEECDDGNDIQFDGCYNCKFQCQESCTKCQLGDCQECAGGWYIDPQTWRCKERCGDLILVGQEQCEDRNQLDNDGCKECRFQCSIDCSSCNQLASICESCQFPGFIPNQYFCENNCGDGFVVVDPSGKFTEICDDIGCNTDCKSCKEGYVLINSICEPICYDSLLVEKEMCEDTFILPYRGCQNCKSKCQLSCLICDTTGKGCLSCEIGYEIFDYICYSICGDQIITIDEECDDGNLIIGDGCHFCQYSCQDSCLNCIKGKCLNCLDNYQLVISTCQQKCDNNIPNPFGQCDYIISSNDGCYQCLQCPENCDFCQNGICVICQNNFELDNIYNQCIQIQFTQFEIQQNCVQLRDNQCLTQSEAFIDLITNQDFVIDRCPQNCKICIFNNCMECQQGYYGKICMSKCGDNIIVSEEECDDGKGWLPNECYNCKLICPDFCKSCIFGICQECQSGFYIDMISNTCNTICGDNILASNEICDDGNNIEFDGCFQCQYQCEIECIDCQFGKCVQCQEKFILSKSKEKCESVQSCEPQDGLYYENNSNSCVNLCGDGIVAGNEECDDSNTIPYDGCNECKFQCNQQCILCEKGICLIESCQLGAILINNSCCGDTILNGDEECDDGNQIDFDGCSNCQFQCNKFCSVCLQGICVECIEEYKLEDNKCIKNEYNVTENQQSKKIDQNQDEICRNNECAFSLRPQMRLVFINQTFNHQYIEINFDQQVQLAALQDEEQLQIFEILIQDLNEQYYNIQLYTILGIGQDLQDVQYVIDIEIYLELQEKPNLQITLIQNVVNFNNQTIIQPQRSILLYIPRIMSQELKSKAISISKTNIAFMISAISISTVSLIFGEASLFIETLSTLQYQSYLKFINLEYPENLYMYFQTSEMYYYKKGRESNQNKWKVCNI